MKIIAIVCLFISSSLFAQKDFRAGFIVTNSGDTIRGDVDYRLSSSGSSKCTFKPKGKQEVVEYLPSDIASYGVLNESSFVSKEVPTTDTSTERVFIEPLLKGEVSLYRFGDIFFAEKDKFYRLELIEETGTNSTTNYVVSKKKYAGVLNYLFLKCPSLSSEVMRTSFKEKPLIKLTRKYHQCVGEKYEVLKKKQSYKVVPHVVGGISFSYLDFASESPSLLDHSPKLTGSSPIYGVGIHFMPPSRGATFVIMELLYTKTDFSGSYDVKRTSTPTKETYTMSISRIKVPIGLGINLFSKPSTPYVKGGFSFNFQTIDHYKVDRTITFGNYNIYDTKLDNFFLPQAWLSAGYQLNLSKSLKGFFEVRGEALGGKSNKILYSDEDEGIVTQKKLGLKGVSFLVGIGF